MTNPLEPRYNWDVSSPSEALLAHGARVGAWDGWPDEPALVSLVEHSCARAARAYPEGPKPQDSRPGLNPASRLPSGRSPSPSLRRVQRVSHLLLMLYSVHLLIKGSLALCVLRSPLCTAGSTTATCGSSRGHRHASAFCVKDDPWPCLWIRVRWACGARQATRAACSPRTGDSDASGFLQAVGRQCLSSGRTCCTHVVNTCRPAADRAAATAPRPAALMPRSSTPASVAARDALGSNIVSAPCATSPPRTCRAPATVPVPVGIAAAGQGLAHAMEILGLLSNQSARSPQRLGHGRNLHGLHQLRPAEVQPIHL